MCRIPLQAWIGSYGFGDVDEPVKIRFDGRLASANTTTGDGEGDDDDQFRADDVKRETRT